MPILLLCVDMLFSIKKSMSANVYPSCRVCKSHIKMNVLAFDVI